MPNAELSEVLRFALGLLGLVMTLSCVWETLEDYLLLRRARPHDQERLIVGLVWVRAAFARLLTCTMLTVTGWILMGQPPTNIANTFEGIAVRWLWVVLGAYMVVQSLWGRWDRRQIRRIRREEQS